MRAHVDAGRANVIYEEVFRDPLLAVPASNFKFEDITGLSWAESDFAENLARAHEVERPMLKGEPADEGENGVNGPPWDQRLVRMLVRPIKRTPVHPDPSDRHRPGLRVDGGRFDFSGAHRRVPTWHQASGTKGVISGR